MARKDDVLEVRSLIEPEIQTYLRSPRDIADLRDLCARVALKATSDAYPFGFTDGRQAARAMRVKR